MTLGTLTMSGDDLLGVQGAFRGSNHMGPEHASREKILSMVIFSIFVHKNVYSHFRPFPYSLFARAQIAKNAVSRQNSVCLGSSLSMRSFAIDEPHS